MAATLIRKNLSRALDDSPHAKVATGSTRTRASPTHQPVQMFAVHRTSDVLTGQKQPGTAANVIIFAGPVCTSARRHLIPANRGATKKARSSRNQRMWLTLANSQRVEYLRVCCVRRRNFSTHEASAPAEPPTCSPKTPGMPRVLIAPLPTALSLPSSTTMALLNGGFHQERLVLKQYLLQTFGHRLKVKSAGPCVRATGHQTSVLAREPAPRKPMEPSQVRTHWCFAQLWPFFKDKHS